MPAPLRPLLDVFDADEPWWTPQFAAGTDRSYRSWMWIAPYPPSQRLAIACSWAGMDIAPVSHTLAVPRPDEVAERVISLWED